MRSLVLLLLGLAVGAAFTLIGTNYLRQATAYPKGVMAVMHAQMKALGHSIEQNRCATTELTSRLAMLRYLGNDIEHAFGDMPNNDQFARYANDLRAAADAALGKPAIDCVAAEAALGKIDKACDGCHRDYAN